MSKKYILVVLLLMMVLVPGSISHATTTETTEATMEDGRGGGHRYPGDRDGGHTSAGEHLKVEAKQDTGLFTTYGQFWEWMRHNECPLPEPYHITFLDVFIDCILLFFVGWLIGSLVYNYT